MRRTENAPGSCSVKLCDNHERARSRRGRTLFVLALCCTGTIDLGCATPPKAVVQPAAPQSEDDRQALYELAQRLGHQAPEPHAHDPLRAMVEVGYEKSKVELKAAPALQRRATQVHLTSYQQRVAQIEVGFLGGCDVDCTGALDSQLSQWLGPPHVVTEGNAKISTFAYDTTEVVLEAYPRRPDLTRLILRCQPLMALGAGRASRLPAVGNRPEPSLYTPCRALPEPPVPEPPVPESPVPERP